MFYPRMIIKYRFGGRKCRGGDPSIQFMISQMCSLGLGLFFTEDSCILYGHVFHLKAIVLGPYFCTLVCVVNYCIKYLEMQGRIQILIWGGGGAKDSVRVHISQVRSPKSLSAGVQGPLKGLEALRVWMLFCAI